MTNRMPQVNSLIQKKLGEIFIQNLEIPSDFLITISKVAIAPDLKTGKVYLSILPFVQSKKALSFIINQRNEIRHELAKKIKLKYTPKLTYHIDDTQERVAEIEKLMT